MGRLAGLFSTVIVLSLGAASAALAQSPPTLEEYSMRDRLFGTGGALSPNYVAPYEHTFAFMTGRAGGPKGTAFGAATVDYNCQTEQRPQITILSAPAKGKVVVTPGTFIATGTDAGSTKCLGMAVSGAVVRYVGRPPKGGATIALRVTYPTMGAWYDHVVEVR